MNLGKKKENLILIGSIGQCVHVAGCFNFMEIAQKMGYKCEFLGPAISVEKIIDKIEELNPEILALSYRLTAKTVKPLIQTLFNQLKKLEKQPNKIFFAGTPEVIEETKKIGQFDACFMGGESRFEIMSALKGEIEEENKKSEIPRDLISRIRWKKPYPVIRAHFGLPGLEETIEGLRDIADSKVLDIISIAPDQNTQANYYHPEDRDEELNGAGGVPLRSKDDFLKLHQARQTGNYPLLRIYAGTRDFVRLAELYQETIQNAWAAIPIFWFNQMDGRGPLPLKKSIQKHLNVIEWHAERDIPVEINDPHHWSLRNAPDAIAVADMFLCGIIAKKLGVKHFIAQFMFNTPVGSSLEMDLAKIMAKLELLTTLDDENFTVIKQVRTGLASFPLNLNRAKGHLASASLVQLAIKPDIVHVVSHTEADHAAKPNEIIESCEIVEQVINNSYSSELELVSEKIINRKSQLIQQANWILNLVPQLAQNQVEKQDPWINPNVLTRLVKYGIFDAPHLKNNPFARGQIETKIIDGACYSWDSSMGSKIDEVERIKSILSKFPQFTSDSSIKSNQLKKEVIIE